MIRHSLPKRLCYGVGLVVVALALFFSLSRGIERKKKPKLSPEPTARSEMQPGETRRPRNVSEQQASEIRARLAPLLTRIPPQEPEPPAEVPEEQRVIHGMTPEERQEKGFTRMRLFASRSGVRFTYLANALESIGRDELAARMKVLSDKFAKAHNERDEDKVAWGDLLTEQMEVLNEAFRIALDGETDSKFFRAVVARSVEDMENAMSGNLESVDRKIEDELTETRDKDELDEIKEGGDGAPKGDDAGPERTRDETKSPDQSGNPSPLTPG